MKPFLARIVSGGQSGVDRAALDFALAHGIAYGGWCPNGGWAEDLPDPPGLLAHYANLRETPSCDPRQRTEWNVRDADGTLILDRRGCASPGTAFATATAERLSKPFLIVELDEADPARRICVWLEHNPAIRTLNIAGPRESEAPGIYDAALAVLRALR
jgi:hypothetical protein